MRAGDAQGTANDRIGKSTGDALAKAYPPDRAADDQIDRLIEQLGQVPWAKKETRQ